MKHLPRGKHVGTVAPKTDAPMHDHLMKCPECGAWFAAISALRTRTMGPCHIRQRISGNEMPRTHVEDCPMCQNARWVCEEHPDQDGGHGIGGKRKCGGAGMPMRLLQSIRRPRRSARYAARFRG